jgi:large subunit ribosomal protein L10
MDHSRKIELAEKLREELSGTSAFVLVEFSRLTVKAVDDLRGKFREAGCTYHVYKNSTIRFAVQETKHEPIKELLKGVSALAYHPEDPAAPARIARDFAKDHAEFRIKGGVSDGELLREKDVLRLADLPGPQELKAMFLALLNTPATNMVRVLNAPAQSLLYVLNAKKDKDAA